jgi:flagellar hook-length control protein FliK
MEPLASDPVVPEGRIEPVVESAPTTPTTVTASSLSRASIETTALLAAQIARRLEGRSTRFDMALTPEGLGRVDVRVEIDADGQLAARLAFDNPAAATELRGRADELRRQLEDAGFTLSRDALDFSERDSSSGGQGAFERQQRRAAYAHRLSSEPDLSAVPATWSAQPGTPRGVDVKV